MKVFFIVLFLCVGLIVTALVPEASMKTPAMLAFATLTICMVIDITALENKK